MRTPRLPWLVVLVCSFLFSASAGAQEFGDTIQHFAQVAVGGGATTLFSLYNPGPEALEIGVSLYRSDGTLLQAQAVEVPAHGTRTVSFGGAEGELAVGWARLFALAPFAATEFFQLRVGTQDLPRVGVLPSQPANQIRAFCYIDSGQTSTGIAVANPSDAETAHLTVRRLDPQGTVAETRTFDLGPRQHKARFFDEEPYFPGLADFEGMVEIESSGAVIAVSLRSDQTQLSAVAVLTPQMLILGPGAVHTEHLQDGAVTTEKLADGAVTRGKIASGQVVTSVNGLADEVELVAGANVSITPSGQTLTIAATGGGGGLAEVAHDSTLTGAGTAGSALGLADGAVTTAKLAGNAVTGANIATDAVTSYKIADGAVGPDDLASGAVRQQHVAAGTPSSGQVLGTDGSQLRWQDDSLKIPFVHEGALPSYGPAITIGDTQALVATMGSFSGWSNTAISVTVDKAAWHGIISDSEFGDGVMAGSVYANGVFATSQNGYGVEALSWSSDALVGTAKVANKSGVYGISDDANGYAGYFNGRVHVNGTLSKSAGGFKIDHPLDPENRYLNHSFVESSDMKNIYDGVVELDVNGEAWIELPEWFEALNRDFRYQLTSVGAPAPGLYVAEKVANNRFKIAGGAAGLEVSWQVTGIRQDNYADANRIVVEEDKRPEERGTYLHPQAWGRPETAGVEWVRRPQLMRELQEDRERGGPKLLKLPARETRSAADAPSAPAPQE
jgi:hypothetical protein